MDSMDTENVGGNILIYQIIINPALTGCMLHIAQMFIFLQSQICIVVFLKERK